MKFTSVLALLISCVCLISNAHGQSRRANSAGNTSAAKSKVTAPGKTTLFIKQNCFDCHAGAGSEAGLDLEKLSNELTDANADRWVRIFDRVHDGEMPPPEYGELDAKKRDSFLEATSSWIAAVQKSEYQKVGRVKARRLTNLQLERTLHDLLGIDIPLASRMPQEPRTAGFNTVADGQAMSHFQLEQHLDVVDAALGEAFGRGLNNFEGDNLKRILPAEKIVRRDPERRTREPEMLDGHAVVWSGALVFYGRTPATTAPESGWYKFKIRAKGLKVPENKNIWCTVRSGECVSGSPLMSWVHGFEVDENYKEVTFEAWLPKRHLLEIRPGDLTLKRARFEGGQVGAGEGGPQDVPGLAIKSIEMERIHKGPDNLALRQMLFGDLKLDTAETKRKLISNAPQADLAKLIYGFAQRAFRRPTTEVSINPYVELAVESFKKDKDFAGALQTGYRAILCSPRFLYLQESVGQLDDYSIASRLSYLIWNRMPDRQLLRLAAEKKLTNKRAISRQVDRMLADPKGKNFVVDLADQWLDLNLIDFTEPDQRLYPGFDVIVQDSMLQETHLFLQKMLDDDLSVGHLIDSDFTFLNSRLADYYNVEGVQGDSMQQVSLKPSPKTKQATRPGGLLTHGAIMKVTANGTNTSPVIRGVWVSERLLGQEIPPPPENIPAIEPDIRGAKTIRDMLAKHKENGDCAACHRKIDPPGFALEHFDPSGRWRENYVTRKDKKLTKKPIDSSFVMPDGKPFKNIDEFKKLVLSNKKQLAKNVCEKLLVYGTGETVQFADRIEIEKAIEQSAASDFGFRSLLKSVVTSKTFLTK